jgi:hypothetical protein
MHIVESPAPSDDDDSRSSLPITLLCYSAIAVLVWTAVRLALGCVALVIDMVMGR